MRIMHIALGGCLTAPPVRYGLTEDTGGHIAYVLEAAAAQARRADVSHVEIVTRAFVEPSLGLDCRTPRERIGPKLVLTRLATGRPGYLSKAALEEEIPALTGALLDLLAARAAVPDVIHAHFADAARLARAAARRFGCKTVYTPHSLALDKARHLEPGRPGGVPGLARRVAQERAALRGADAVIVSSRDEAERQVEAYDAGVSGWVHRLSPGATLAPPGPGDDTAARALVAPFLDDPDRPAILAVARPVRRKNLSGLLRAYARSPELQARADLVILAGQRGAGAEESAESREVIDELLALAACPGLAGRVALPPRHSAAEAAALYRRVARGRGVFANVAFHEPFGLTILEAAQAGLPVVATREGGAGDIVAALGHGRTVDPRDGGAIAAALLGLLSDAAARRRAARCAKAGLAAFDWDAWARGALRVCRAARPAVPVGAGAGRLLVCDIDGTLTGCAAAAARFRDWRARRDTPFAVATGRSLSEARAVLAAWDLPEPDLFITAVGTEIHRVIDGRLRPCAAYAAHLDHGWDRAGVMRAIEQSGLPLQAGIEQRRWKLACFGDAAAAGRLSRHLAAAGIAARVVASHGHLVDVLAPRGGKAAAVAIAAAQMGLGLEHCIAAGDSGNDADMLAACGTGIVVANALPELARAIRGPGVYRARARHADGVLEGLAAASAVAP